MRGVDVLISAIPAVAFLATAALTYRGRELLRVILRNPRKQTAIIHCDGGSVELTSTSKDALEYAVKTTVTGAERSDFENVEINRHRRRSTSFR